MSKYELVSSDEIIITVINLYNKEMTGIEDQIFEYNGKIYPFISDLHKALYNKYPMTYGEVKSYMNKYRSRKLQVKYPNLQLKFVKKIRIDTRKVKYAIDATLIYKKGHHSLAFINEDVIHDFKDSDIRLDIIRLRNGFYSLNEEFEGSDYQLLTYLNNKGVDITCQQFIMMKGHKVVPKSILKHYPNMTYTEWSNKKE